MKHCIIKPLIYCLFLFTILISSCTKKEDPVPTPEPKPAPVIPTPSPDLGTSKTYFVSPDGMDTNTGLSASTPFKTIAKAAALTNAGDVVQIMNGTYHTSSGTLINITRSGTEGKYITYQPYPGHTPKLTVSGNVWDLVIIDASYIVFEGMELIGDNANLTLADAEQAYLASRASPAVFTGVYNTGGIIVARNGNPHHITIRNCKIHDFPAGGIGVFTADYLTIDGNTIYNTSWYTMYASSGISVFGPKAIDAVTTYKIIIRGNTCYNNKCLVKWRTGNVANDRLSDGNGIILDANNGTQGKPIYTGRTLVENNVCYNNGGGGIHAFQAARVDIVNNTAYNNGTVVGYPEIDGQSGTDVKIFNNIMYARSAPSQTSNNPGTCNGNDASIYTNNVYFNGTFFNAGSTNKNLNPLFVNLSTNPGVANFSLQLASPAINAGTSLLFAPTDIMGVLRPKGGIVDCGAYEVN